MKNTHANHSYNHILTTCVRCRGSETGIQVPLDADQREGPSIRGVS